MEELKKEKEKRLLEFIYEKYPGFPLVKRWEKGNLVRYYFNKKEQGIDNTFFIDITGGNCRIDLKKGAIWHESYPNFSTFKNEVINFLNSMESQNTNRRDKDNQKVQENIDPKYKNMIDTDWYEVNTPSLGKLYAYHFQVVDNNKANILGGRAAYALQNFFGGYWVLSYRQIISNKNIPDQDFLKFLQEKWKTEPNKFGKLLKIWIDSSAKINTIQIAEYTAQLLRRKFRNEIKRIMAKNDDQIDIIQVKKEITIRGWNIHEIPCVSIDISSNIFTKQRLSEEIKTMANPEGELKGRKVIDILGEHTGKIEKVLGKLKEHRTRLLNLTSRKEIKACIENGPDDELVVLFESKSDAGGGYEYSVGSLHTLIDFEQAELYNINRDDLMEKLTLSPEERKDIKKPILKLFGNYLTHSINSVDYPQFFKNGIDIGFEAKVKFGDGYIADEKDFVLSMLNQHGFSKLLDQYKTNPIRILALKMVPQNTYKKIVDKILEDFEFVNVKAEIIDILEIPDMEYKTAPKIMNRLRKRDFDTILGIFPNRFNNKTQNDIYIYFKRLLVNNGFIQSQFIFEETIEEKLRYASANVTLGMLSKLGNIPFLLKKPQEFADYFVGIDVSRQNKEKLAGTMNYPASVRFYNQNGTLDHYLFEEDSIEGEEIPLELLEKMFADQNLRGKSVMIHRDGYFRGDEIKNINKIGKDFNISFLCVEVVKRNCPRVYKVSEGKYDNAPKDTIFYFNNSEAVIINNKLMKKKGITDKTINPLRIKIRPGTNLNDAIISAMSLRMMHFGSTKKGRLPLTIHFSDIISNYIRKGIKPLKQYGVDPWWL